MPSDYLVFDIETVGLPFDSFDEARQEYLVRSAQNDDERNRKIAEMALSPMTGQIVCIGVQVVRPLGNDEWDIRSAAYTVDPAMADTDERRESTLPSGATMYSSSERTLLEHWWRLLETRNDRVLVSFNGRGFDAPFLMLRSAVLGLRPSKNLMAGTRFNYAGHIDLIDELTYYSGAQNGATRRFNFDFFAKSFGITSPKEAGIDGSKVGDFYRDGRMADIAEYCLRDVRATWELFLRWDTLLRF